MTIFYEFIRNIAVYMIFCSLAGIFVPDGKFKGYVELVLNIILVLILIAPLAAVLQVDMAEAFNSFNMQFGRRVTLSEFVPNDEPHNEMILSIFKDNLTVQTRRVVEGLGEYRLERAEFVVGRSAEDFGVIKEIHLDIVPESSGRGVLSGLIRIEPITFQQGSGRSLASAEDEQAEVIISIKNALADFYNIPSSNIHVTVATAVPLEIR